MGFMNKVKKILFDEEEIEVPVTPEELPKKHPVKQEKKVERTGFVDHSKEMEKEKTKEIKKVNNSEERSLTKELSIPDAPKETEHRIPNSDFFPGDEKDTIKEVVVPKEEPVRRRRGVNFPIEDDFESKVSRRVFEEDKPKEKPKKEIRMFSKREPLKKEEKVFSSVNAKTIDPTKKPFKVTPVISPVYGVLDKNYKPEEIVEKREKITKTNNSPNTRNFGPVSYNDQPLRVKEEELNLADEKDILEDYHEQLAELNSTINDLATEEIKEDTVINVTQPKVEKKLKRVKKVIEEEPAEVEEIDNFIEEEKMIEDEFEPTSELEKIKELDKQKEEEKSEIEAIDEYLDSEINDDMSDTMETNLFNLIDSMYKDDDSGEDD